MNIDHDTVKTVGETNQVLNQMLGMADLGRAEKEAQSAIERPYREVASAARKLYSVSRKLHDTLVLKPGEALVDGIIEPTSQSILLVIDSNSNDPSNKPITLTFHATKVNSLINPAAHFFRTIPDANGRQRVFCYATVGDIPSESAKGADNQAPAFL